MPLYEYQCEGCGHKKETLQKMSDAPLVVCPECGESKLKKLISAAGFRLKGSGWYETDFKNSGSKPVAKSGDTSTAGGSSSDGSAKSDKSSSSDSGSIKSESSKSSGGSDSKSSGGSDSKSSGGSDSKSSGGSDSKQSAAA